MEKLGKKRGGGEKKIERSHQPFLQFVGEPLEGNVRSLCRSGAAFLDIGIKNCMTPCSTVLRLTDKKGHNKENHSKIDK